MCIDTAYIAENGYNRAWFGGEDIDVNIIESFPQNRQAILVPNKHNKSFGNIGYLLDQ